MAHHVVMDPSYASNTWRLLRGAIREIHRFGKKWLFWANRVKASVWFALSHIVIVSSVFFFFFRSLDFPEKAIFGCCLFVCCLFCLCSSLFDPWRKQSQREWSELRGAVSQRIQHGAAQVRRFALSRTLRSCRRASCVRRRVHSYQRKLSCWVAQG